MQKYEDWYVCMYFIEFYNVFDTLFIQIISYLSPHHPVCLNGFPSVTIKVWQHLLVDLFQLFTRNEQITCPSVHPPVYHNIQLACILSRRYYANSTQVSIPLNCLSALEERRVTMAGIRSSQVIFQMRSISVSHPHSLTVSMTASLHSVTLPSEQKI